MIGDFNFEPTPNEPNTIPHFDATATKESIAALQAKIMEYYQNAAPATTETLGNFKEKCFEYIRDKKRVFLFAFALTIMSTTLSAASMNGPDTGDESKIESVYDIDLAKDPSLSISDEDIAPPELGGPPEGPDDLEGELNNLPEDEQVLVDAMKTGCSGLENANMIEDGMKLLRRYKPSAYKILIGELEQMHGSKNGYGYKYLSEIPINAMVNYTRNKNRWSHSFKYNNLQEVDGRYPQIDTARLAWLTDLIGDEIGTESNKFDKQSFIQDPHINLGLADKAGSANTLECLSGLSQTNRTEAYLQTIRAMHRLSIEGNPESFTETYESLESIQANEEFLNTEVIEGSRILLFAHNESAAVFNSATHKSTDDRFANEHIQRWIKFQNPYNGEIRKTKSLARLLQSIEDPEAPKEAPLTLVFHGHGNIDKGDKEPVFDTGLSHAGSNTIVRSLIKRQRSGIHSPVNFINMSCFSNNYVRAVHEGVKKHNTEQSERDPNYIPINLKFGFSTAEYNQLSWSSPNAKTHNTFVDLMYSKQLEKESAFYDLVTEKGSPGFNNAVDVVFETIPGDELATDRISIVRMARLATKRAEGGGGSLRIVHENRFSDYYIKRVQNYIDQYNKIQTSENPGHTPVIIEFANVDMAKYEAREDKDARINEPNYSATVGDFINTEKEYRNLTEEAAGTNPLFNPSIMISIPSPAKGGGKLLKQIGGDKPFEYLQITETDKEGPVDIAA